MPIVTDRPLAELRRGDHADLHAIVEHVLARRTRDGQPFFILRVRDLTASGTVYVFADHNAFAPTRSAVRGDVVKLRVVVDKSGDALEMKARELRVERDLSPPELAAVFGPLRDELVPVARGTVGFDIETMPRLDVEELPERERDKFLRVAAQDARRETAAPGPEALQASVQKMLALHPLTTRIVSIGFHQLETGAELCLVATADDDLTPPALAMPEEELLVEFWALARRVRSLVGFNSRRFDVPVLLSRSALLDVRASVDLLSRPYDEDGRHVDIYEVLRANGAARDRRVSLELAAFAFGIPAKRSGHGSDVAELYADGRFDELATYNLEDARATAQLYDRLRGTWV